MLLCGVWHGRVCVRVRLSRVLRFSLVKPFLSHVSSLAIYAMSLPIPNSPEIPRTSGSINLVENPAEARRKVRSGFR